MRKALVLCALFAVAFAVTLWVVGRGSRRPPPSPPAEIESARDFLARQQSAVQAADENGEGRVVLRLRPAEVRLLLVGAAAERSEEVAAGLQGLAVKLAADRMILEVEVSPEALAASDLELPPLAALGRLVEGARALAGARLPLVVSGRPIAEAGGLGLAPEELEVRLGPLLLPLDDLVQGGDGETPRTPRFEIPGLVVEDVRVESEVLVLAARAAGL